MPALSDEEWAEIAGEIPQASDPFIQKYLQGRDELVSQEQRQRSDHAFKQSLSPIARRACAIVERIRLEENGSVWTTALEEKVAERGHVFPGMMFSLAKDAMETTQLWRIVRRMPKGALLHGHNDAMADFDFLIAVLLDTEGMCVACGEGGLATAQQREERIPEFRFVKSPPADVDAASLWRDDYKAGTFVPITKAADSFPSSSSSSSDGSGGGRAAFTAWLKSRVTLSRTDSTEQHHGQDHIWRKFINCFRITGSMMHYEPVFRRFLQRVMTLLHEDGVAWAELRHTWPLDYRREGREEPETDYMHMFTVIDEEVTAFKQANPGFWGVRMIWSSLRSADERTMASDMMLCVETKLAFPHLVVGYDVVGQEDAGPSLKDLLPKFAWFKKLCAQEGVNIPFFFHAGETLGDGTETDQNLFDAVLLGTRRIGHGFSLHKHPLLIDLVKQKRILIESCPISNEVLRLCGSILSHPLPALLARGVPCALSNDDPGMLGHDTAGATHDFWQALQGWDNLGLGGLGSLAENSIRWSAFEDETDAQWKSSIQQASLGSGIKAQRLKEWAIKWEDFCLWIVDEYGDKYGEE
ncbi:hypothetical protein MCOR34_006165 [Pyricularia oryzae]|nr:hypothetical protein MCOR34_006165 [Pyricularia oryzae]KAI6461225.1 hypothetical protein MCOR17_006437 [Pyricularia oryzae]